MTDAANNAAFLGEDEGFSAPRTPPPANGEKSSSTTNGVRSKKHATSSHGEPGSAWQNKKWEDDYAKAYAALQDQSWSMSELLAIHSYVTQAKQEQPITVTLS
jgi:hypothetical protein